MFDLNNIAFVVYLAGLIGIVAGCIVWLIIIVYNNLQALIYNYTQGARPWDPDYKEYHWPQCKYGEGLLGCLIFNLVSAILFAVCWPLVVCLFVIRKFF